MLSAIVVRSHPTLTRSAAMCLFRQSRVASVYPLSRGISSSSSSKNSLTDEQAQASTVGPHPQQRPVSPKGEVHQHGRDHIITGDWVLFHPVYSPNELKAVEAKHREPTCFSDKVAASLVKLCRWGYNLFTGYKHKTLPPAGNMTLAELRKEGYLLDDKAWLNRILFLESIAGVPGMVAATLRHLTSLRLMRRDNGWIHTCLEEAENERMHLMTFMTLRKPSIFFRAMILGAQGVFYNLFFLSYLISPRISHRFVGYLEEEAVVTYTKCIKDIEAGYVPEWSDMPAPSIAIDYWRLPSDAKLLDVLYAVRSDETTHRFVNHSLANLSADNDVNPFALMEPDMHTKGKKIAFEQYSAPVSRRWTLAMAMTSHDLSDENFVQQVELMRRASVTQFSDEGDESYYHGLPYDEYDENEDASTSYHHSQVHGNGQVPSMPDLRIRVPSVSFPASPTSPTSPTTLLSPSTSAPETHAMYAPLPFEPPTAESEWTSALHALLITRDLLRTERTYLASLMLLLDSSPCGTPNSPNSRDGAMNGFFGASQPHVPNHHSHPSTIFPSPESIELRTNLLWPTYPPPPLMHTYLCSLIATSSMLLAKFEADPSVMGAANALLSSEDEVERVFVGWCGVVGGWFEDKRRSKSFGGEPGERRRRLSKTKFTSSPSPSTAGSRSVSMVFSTPPPMPDLPLPPLHSQSPSRPMSQISSSTSRPISQRIPSLRPLSMIHPPVPAEAIKTAPLPPRKGLDLPRARISKEETPLPPIPVEDQRGRQPPAPINGYTSTQVPIITGSEDGTGEVAFPSVRGRDTSVSTRGSFYNSPGPMRSPSTGLLGLVVGRLASSTSLGGSPVKDKEKARRRKLSKSKSRRKTHDVEGSESKEQFKVERSKSVLLFGSRSRTRTSSPERIQAGQTQSSGSTLKRSMSEYLKKSLGSRSPSSNPIQKDIPVLGLSAVERHGGQLNGDSNGNNTSNSTSTSGHGTDEGFYSEGGVTADGHGYTSTLDGHGYKEKPTVNVSVNGSSKKPGGGIIGVGGKRVYSVRDLAILPVQRVTRYTLLYRDLLKHTPATSPVRPLLEHAVEASRRIALKCDKAQGNAELLRRR